MHSPNFEVRCVSIDEIGKLIVSVSKALGVNVAPVLSCGLTWDGRLRHYFLSNGGDVGFKLLFEGADLFLPVTTKVLKDIIYAVTKDSRKMICPPKLGDTKMTNESNEQKDFLDEVLFHGTPRRDRMYASLVSQQRQEMYNERKSETMRIVKGRYPDDQPYKLKNSAVSGAHIPIKGCNQDFDGTACTDLLIVGGQLLAVSTPRGLADDLDIMSSYWQPAFSDSFDFIPYNVLSDDWVEQDRRETSEVYDLENMPRFFSRRLYDVAYFKHLEAIHDFYRQADDDHFEYEQQTSELLFKQRLLSLKHLNVTTRYGISGSIDNSPMDFLYANLNVPMKNIDYVVNILRMERMPCQYNTVLISKFESERRDLCSFKYGRTGATKIERSVLDYVKAASRR